VRIATRLSNIRSLSPLKRVGSSRYTQAGGLASKQSWKWWVFVRTLAVAFWYKGGNLL